MLRIRDKNKDIVKITEKNKVNEIDLATLLKNVKIKETKDTIYIKLDKNIIIDTDKDIIIIGRNIGLISWYKIHLNPILKKSQREIIKLLRNNFNKIRGLFKNL